MQRTLAPGQWALVILVALPLTLAASVVLLWMYRRGLQAPMLAKADLPSSGSYSGGASFQTPFHQPALRAPIRVITVDEVLAGSWNSTLNAVASVRWRRA